MAACTTTYFESGRSLGARVAERNTELMAQQLIRRRGVRTPEFYFARSIDNLPPGQGVGPGAHARNADLSVAATFLLSLVMVYGLQHFYAIESGYRVESEKQTLDQLREENRQLRLSEAQLSQPSRIDSMARQLGLAEPQPGQVIHPNARAEAGTPAIAQMIPPAPAAQ